MSGKNLASDGWGRLHREKGLESTFVECRGERICGRIKYIGDFWISDVPGDPHEPWSPHTKA